MATLALIGCAKSKVDMPAPAAKLYKSALFDKARRYAAERADSWFILSAKHGLLSPEKVVEPYDETLKRKPKNERAVWADRVFEKLTFHLSPGDQVLFLAGLDYREFLTEKLEAAGFAVKAPLKGLSLGMQLQTLDRLNTASLGREHVNTFYGLLDILSVGLDGGRLLGECKASSGWPDRGIYFLFEPGETRRDLPLSPRVIRIGTHAVSKGSKSTLWNRLSTHRGTEKGTGSHRSSVFRLHVGAAIIRKSRDELELPTWGEGQNASKKIRAAEEAHERQVSSYMAKLRVLWLNIGDMPGPASDRAFVERNTIALLSNLSFNSDRPTREWLGNHSAKQEIRNSGLWNVNYVGDIFDERVLPVIEKYVEATIGQREPPKRALAPKRWHELLMSGRSPNQLELL